MSLYGRTDSNANKAKADIGVATDSQTKTILYIDETEAQLAQNKNRGLNAPGWWSYFSYNDSSGNTRYKAEQMVFIAGGEANADETQADDTIASDAAAAITIGTQPANASVAATNTQAFTVAATKTGGGSLTYQWQVSTDGGATFANTTTGTNSTTATYTTAATAAGDNGNQYRVKVNTTTGAPEVVSAAATLTVT
tara:strand:- start:27 stop:614 length:588 start_codon:yes stop_codon:yes gene_type:complete